MVADHVEDLDVAAARKPPVGDVGLPRLVGHLGFEADQRGARALLGLRRNQALPPEDPPDSRDRGDAVDPLAGEVVSDRLGAAVVSLREQLLSQGHDGPDHLPWRAIGTGARRPGARLQRLIAAFPVTSQELVGPAAMNAVGRCKL